MKDVISYTEEEALESLRVQCKGETDLKPRGKRKNYTVVEDHQLVKMRMQNKWQFDKIAQEMGRPVGSVKRRWFVLKAQNSISYTLEERLRMEEAGGDNWTHIKLLQIIELKAARLQWKEIGQIVGRTTRSVCSQYHKVKDNKDGQYSVYEKYFIE